MCNSSGLAANTASRMFSAAVTQSAMLLTILLATLLTFSISATAADAPSATPPANTPPAPADAPRLALGQLKLRYFNTPNGVPPVADITTNALLPLRAVDGGYTSVPSTDITGADKLNISDLQGSKVSQNGLRAIELGIRRYINSKGIISAFVYTASADAKDSADGPDALDFNLAADTNKPVDLQFVIVIGVVKQIRTIDSGEAGPLPFLSTTRPINQRIQANSPIQPGSAIHQQALQDYLYRVNRQPGTHVETAISSANTTSEDELTLDYLVHLSKPWIAYVEGSNTATRKDHDWEERFGFTDNQLTGNNDIFNVEFDTDSFRGTYTLTGSYEVPVLSSDQVRTRVYGSVGKFNASDIGQAGENLLGDTAEGGAEGIINVFQYHQLFVDAVAGARLDYYSVRNKSVGNPISEADGDFLLPYVGFRLDRETDLAVTHAGVNFEFNPTIPDSPTDSTKSTHSDTVEKLGRTSVTKEHYMILQAEGSQSVYIEPLLANWETRNKEIHPTAANELFGSFRGQYAMDNRQLIPELEETAGGLYSVRGYPEAASAGDTVIVATAEYRLHIPRLLGVGSPNSLMGRHLPSPPLMNNGDFYYQPRAVDAPGDWDLIAKAFVDGGYVHDNLQGPGDKDQGLIGVGGGLELHVRDNLIIRTEYGVALRPLEGRPDTDVSEGSGRFNFVFTLLY